MAKKHGQSGNMQEAIRITSLAHKGSIKNQYNRGYISSTLNWCNEHLENAKILDSVFNDLEPHMGKLTDPSVWMRYYHLRVQGYELKGEYNKGIEIALKCLAISDSLNDSNDISYAHFLLGNLNGALENNEKAIVHYSIAADIAKQMGNWNSCFQLLQNIGVAHFNTDNLDSSMYYFIKSIRTHERYNINMIGRKFYAYNSLGSILLQQGNLDSAEYYLILARDYLLQNQGTTQAGLLEIENYKELSLLSIKRKKFHKAEVYNNLFTELADTMKILEYQVYGALQKIRISMLKQGMPELALNEYLKLSKQQFEGNKIEASLRLQEQFESVVKDKEILELKNENNESQLIAEKRKNAITIISTSAIFIILLIGLFILRTRSLMNKRLQRLKSQALQLQINPHFFFNAMNSISAYVSKNNPKEAKYYLSKFARLMRLTLENSQNEYVEVQRELEMLENYIALEKVRKDLFDYEIDYPESIAEFKIPSLMLQPFVENSIKHGFDRAQMNTNGLLRISIQPEKNGSKAKIIIEDNGIGFSNSPVNGEHKSMALKILKERLDSYGMLKYGINFQDKTPSSVKAPGARVTFYLPLISN